MAAFRDASYAVGVKNAPGLKNPGADPSVTRRMPAASTEVLNPPVAQHAHPALLPIGAPYYATTGWTNCLTNA